LLQGAQVLPHALRGVVERPGKLRHLVVPPIATAVSYRPEADRRAASVSARIRLTAEPAENQTTRRIRRRGRGR